MDPNANLAEQRRIVARFNAYSDSEDGLNKNGMGFATSEDIERAALRLTELVQALDEWLCKGGFLPKEWVR